MKIKLKETGNYKSVLEQIRDLDIKFDAPCGGNHKCGKCLIKVLSKIDNPSQTELELLGDNYNNGYRLACFLEPIENMEIEINDIADSSNKIMINSDVSLKTINSDLKVFKKSTIKANLENQISDIDSIEENFQLNNLELVNSISKCIRDSNFNPTLISLNKEIVGICSKTYIKQYGIAIDIGTTTVATYLYNLSTGEKIDVVSGLNTQKKYGADVISRIEYASSSEDGLKSLHNAIISQINGMILSLCERNSIICDEIFYITIAGNTTMMHLLMKLNPINIGKAPFIPVTTSLHKVLASNIGININKYGYVALLPSVSGYIGSDITAGVIATGMLHKNKISLLLDIGTNGEIVLGNKKRLISCSTAAGPAFEGANIRFGTGGISGAIDDFKIIDGKVTFTTIDNKPAIGICGSGIVTVVASLLTNEIIDETGRFFDKDEFNLPENLLKRIVEFDNMVAFQITEDIFITQKDIREIQNAKASFAAGVITLIKSYGIKYEDISELYLAGGFGNYIDIDGAIKIGLLPIELKNKVIPSGNTAGTGAIMCLLSSSKMKKIEKISKQIEYIELSKDPSFTDQYIECMMFE